MSISSLDSKIVEFLPLLDSGEKKSILEVIKSFVKLKGGSNEAQSLEEYNNEIDDAMKAMDEGEFYSHEEAKNIATKW